MDALLSMDSGSSTAWSNEVARVVRELFGADRAGLFLPGSEPVLHVAGPGEATLRSYTTHWARLDPGRRRIAERRLEIWSRSTLFGADRAALLDSEYYVEFAEPNGIRDAMGLAWHGGPDGPALLFIHSSRPGTPLFGDRGTALLRVLLPAFRTALSRRRRTQLPAIAELRDRLGLTPRQAEVALLLARGLTNRRVASRLEISPHTARHHTETVLRKLGIHSREHVRDRLLGRDPG